MLPIKNGQGGNELCRGYTAVGGCVSAGALALAKERLATMTAAKVIIVVIMLTCSLAVGAAGLAVYDRAETADGGQRAVGTGPRERGQTKAAKDGTPKKEASVAFDQYGDSLPAGAVARLGTLKFRHEGGVRPRSLQFAPDGKTMIANTKEGILVWDALTGEQLRRFSASQPSAIDLAPDGKSLAINYLDTVLLDFTTGQQLLKLDCPVADPNPGVNSVRYSPDGKTLAVSYSGMQPDHTAETIILLVDLPAGTVRARLSLLDTFFGFAFSPNNKVLASVLHSSKVGTSIVLFDASSGKQLRSLPVKSDNAVSSLAFSPDGRMLARGTTRGVDLFELASGKLRATFEFKQGIMYNLAFTPDGRFLAAGGDAGKARIWDVQSGKIRLDLNCGTDSGLGMAVSRDGKTVAMAGSSVIRFWDLATGQEKSPTRGHDAPIQTVAFTPDGKGVVTGGDNRQIHLWDASTGQHLRQFKPISASGIAISADGKRLVAVGSQPTDPRNRVTEAIIISSVAVRSQPTGPRSGPCYMWDALTGEELLQLRTNATETLISVAFFPGGRQLLTGIHNLQRKGTDSGQFDTSAQVWDADTGKRIEQFRLENLYPQSVAIAPDGQTVAVGGLSTILHPDFDQRILLVDLKTGGKLIKLLGHHGPVESVAFSPNGKLLVSGSVDKTARLWDVAARKELHKLEGHNRTVAAVAFSPTGRLVATAEGIGRSLEPVDDKGGLVVGAPHRIRLWDVATGKEVRCFEGHAAHVTGLAFSPDGSRLIAGLANGTALIWDTQGIAVGPGVQAK